MLTRATFFSTPAWVLKGKGFFAGMDKVIHKMCW